MGELGEAPLSQSLREIAGILGPVLVEGTGATHWALCVREGDKLVVHATEGRGWDTRVGQSYDPPAGPIRRALESAQPQISSHSSAIPIVRRGETVGLVELLNARQASSATLTPILELAGLCIEALRERQRALALSLIDEHTGLFNARHLRDTLEIEVGRASRFGHALSLLFIDLDHFKAVNDQHGHLAGSALLKEMGEVFRAAIRKVDTAYRYGGDEFAIILVETSKAGAMSCAERIRDLVDSRVFLTSRQLQIRLTASVGIATFPTHGTTAPALLQAADQAMYRAKALGRNEVAFTEDITT